LEELLYLVKPQGQLPKINKILKVKDAFDNKVIDFEVKKIKELQWNDMGELIITICGYYVS